VRGRPKRSRDCDTLTVKEETAIALIFKGAGPRRIAELTGESEQTIKNRLTDAYKKLGVSSLHELIGKAWRDGGFWLWAEG
jgi:DNA-binding CsgD family transcriptional regulator